MIWRAVKSVSALAFLTLALGGPLAVADTVYLSLDSSPYVSWANTYINPYSGHVSTVVGHSASGQAATLICDDLVATTYIGVEYKYQRYLASSLLAPGGQGLNNPPLRWANDANSYLAAAYLASQLPAPGNTSDVQQRGLLSFAIWGLFNMTAVDNRLSANNATSFISDVHKLASDALAYVAAGGAVSDFYIYVPDDSRKPQEFLQLTSGTVHVPEPQAFAQLGLNFAALVGVTAFVRRRARV
jgi:hypothetical protein